MHKYFLVALAFAFVSCTDNQMAREFGGTMTVNLEKDRKLVNVTWKDKGSLWVLTRPMRIAEKPETYAFAEQSSFGIVEGKVIFIEQR